MQPQGKRYVKPQTMALALDISTERLLAKARKGEIPCLKLGNGPKARVRFDPEAVIEALQANV
jgi:hypothetical protein